MTRLLGIDLGTSSVKAVIIDEQAQLLGVGTQEYTIDVPQPGYAEQSPETWWQATQVAVRQAVAETGTNAIDAIGLAGQMHGTVLLDAEGQPLYPAIIWADQRSAGEINEMIDLVGKDQLARIVGTAPAAGFMAATVYWLQKHQPALLEQAQLCILPKDYLRFQLTDHLATEASDASSTGLFDIRQRQWSMVIIESLDLPDHLWANVYESSDVVGELSKRAADALGLPSSIPVVAGCADQPAQAIGNGLIDPGVGSVTIGTGGQLLVPLQQPETDKHLRLHTFCHALPDRWYMLGAMLAAGLSLRWLRDLHGMAHDPHAYNKLAALAAQVPPGSEGLIFLPYLVGERSPIFDPNARGCFIGLSLRHDLGHLVRAVMEGAAFALRQSLEVMLAMNIPIDVLLGSGGGLTNLVWRQIVADVFARPIYLSTSHEQAGVGAALIAGLGIGIYSGTNEMKSVVSTSMDVTEPNIQRSQHYNEVYERYIQLYPLLKSYFANGPSNNKHLSI